MPFPEPADQELNEGAWPRTGHSDGWSESVNTDLFQKVAAAADLVGKPFSHGVVALEQEGGGSGAAGSKESGKESADIDVALRIEARDGDGVRHPDRDLDLEIYPSGEDLHLTLAWTAFEERPILWQGKHPVWMDASTGARCERPAEGLPLEALARRLRALLVGG